MIFDKSQLYHVIKDGAEEKSDGKIHCIADYIEELLVGMGQRYTFFFAAKEGRLSDLVWVLNQKNASPDMKDGESQSTALHMTCARGHTKCADLLIKAGAHVNCRTTEGMTPLHFATYGGHFGCVCMLLAAKADVHAATRFGCTALHQAAFFNRLKCAEIIIKNGGGVNTQESWGLTPLSIAAQKGDREMLKLFLLNNALTDVQGKIDGKTPLHLTLEHNHKECVVILLDGGANPDIQDAEGRTALHYACSAHQVETIALILLEFGASPCIENKERERFAERLEKLQSKLISKEKKSEVLRKINEFVGRPRSLLKQCRILVRQTLGPSRINLIDNLPIPNALKQYLQFSDIYDI